MSKLLKVVLIVMGLSLAADAYFIICLTVKIF